MNTSMIITSLYKYIKKLFGCFVGLIRKTISRIYKERIVLVLLAILGVLVTGTQNVKLHECQKMEGKWYFLLSYYSILPDIECMQQKHSKYQSQLDFELNVVSIEQNAKIKKATIEVAENLLKITIPVVTRANGKKVIEDMTNVLTSHITHLQGDSKPLSRNDTK